MDASELARIQDDIDALLSDTAVILSVSYTPDGYGGLTESWGTVTTTACRIDPLSGTETLSGGAIQPYHAFQLTLPHSVTLTTEERIKIGTTTYSVKSVDNGKSWAGSVRAVLEVVV